LKHNFKNVAADPRNGGKLAGTTFRVGMVELAPPGEELPRKPNQQKGAGLTPAPVKFPGSLADFDREPAQGAGTTSSTRVL
jgi:hypothetical protein